MRIIDWKALKTMQPYSRQHSLTALAEKRRAFGHLDGGAGGKTGES